MPIYESSDVTVPMTVGAIRPVIVLPMTWKRWEPDTLAAIVAHEAAHVRRRDATIAVVAVSAKDIARHLSAGRDGGSALFMRGIEFGAAGLVLLFGTGLLFGYLADRFGRQPVLMWRSLFIRSSPSREPCPPITRCC